MILGAGIVGSAAAHVSSGLGAEVVTVDRDLDRLRCVKNMPLGGVTSLPASSKGIRETVPHADLLIGAVLVVDSKTPLLVYRTTAEEIKEGSVIVDADVDQGGSVATTRPTTLLEPIFVEAGVVHSCARNIPASVPVTATRALSNALGPYAKKVVARDLLDALNSDPGSGRGAAVGRQCLVSDTLAREHAMDHHPSNSILPLHLEAQ